MNREEGNVVMSPFAILGSPVVSDSSKESPTYVSPVDTACTKDAAFPLLLPWRRNPSEHCHDLLSLLVLCSYPFHHFSTASTPSDHPYPTTATFPITAGGVPVIRKVATVTKRLVVVGLR